MALACKELLRLPARSIGDIAFAANRQEQGMHAGGIDSIHRAHARDDGGDDWPGQFVDQFAKRCVFLWRSSHHGEGPDSPLAVIDALNAQHRKIVR